MSFYINMFYYLYLNININIYHNESNFIFFIKTMSIINTFTINNNIYI